MQGLLIYELHTRYPYRSRHCKREAGGQQPSLDKHACIWHKTCTSPSRSSLPGVVLTQMTRMRTLSTVYGTMSGQTPHGVEMELRVAPPELHVSQTSSAFTPMFTGASTEQLTPKLESCAQNIEQYQRTLQSASTALKYPYLRLRCEHWAPSSPPQ